MKPVRRVRRTPVKAFVRVKQDTGDLRRESALWVRLAALCGILALLFCSSLQAAHFHRVPGRAHTASVTLLSDGSSADDDAACPLCLTGFSALPTGSSRVNVMLLAWRADCPPVRSRVVPTDLLFVQSVRPPPAFA